MSKPAKGKYLDNTLQYELDNIVENVVSGVFYSRLAKSKYFERCLPTNLTHPKVLMTRNISTSLRTLRNKLIGDTKEKIAVCKLIETSSLLDKDRINCEVPIDEEIQTWIDAVNERVSQQDFEHVFSQCNSKILLLHPY